MRRPATALVLVLLGTAWGQDAKPPAPIDVPGFWTADELRRIDEGLDVLNCTRKDLGFQKRPIDDPFRLAVVNQILDEPLSIGAVTAEWDAVARTGEIRKLLGLASRTLETNRTASRLDMPALGRPEDFNDGRLPDEVRSALSLLQYGVEVTRDDLIGTFAALTTDRDALLKAALMSQVEHPAVVPAAPELTSAAFLEHLQTPNRWLVNSLYVPGGLEFQIARLKEVVAAKPPGLKETVRFETKLGDFVVYGVGDDVHPADENATVVIDLGGNDTYLRGASANLLEDRPVAVVLDLSGDDEYVGKNDFSFGGALGGVAVQWDCAGDDVYLGGNASCGAGILGVGVLVDEGGNDVYRVKDFGEGAGAFGIGLLLDKAGNDLFHADLYGQGFASTWGCGMLVELGGNDVYDAGGEHLHAPLWRDRFQSLSQGFSIGMRPDASGGVGVLVDVAGNDRYSADIYGQGASYWYSLGLLIDDDGHDTYALGQYGQGSGIHLSAGMLLDRRGQDSYYDANGVGMGGAHDWSVGFLVDREGDDYYAGGGGAQGGALTNSVAMLIDDAGDDSYAATRDGTQGSATAARNTGGIGLLLDGAGHDRFTETTRDSGIAVKDIVGACLDEPTPEAVASANPMNAALSKEDAAKKVEADGQTDGKWDLDKLWKLVTQWEVGDNTVTMPIAREKFVALGPPALDRAFQHFDAKDSLLTRAIEKTLDAFPRAEWTPRLLEKTKDPNKLVRKNAVLMVTNLKVAEALPRLTEMLTKDPDTQGGVLAALAALKTAPPEVAALLKAPKESVAVQAAVCLGAVGDDDALAALTLALGPDFAFPVRLAAGERLAALGAKAVPYLASRLPSSPDAPRAWRRNVLKALGATKDVKAWDALRPAFGDADPWIRLSTILAADELLRALPDDVRPGLAAELRQVRDAEKDPLVRRLVVPPMKPAAPAPAAK